MPRRNRYVALACIIGALSACDPFHESDFDRYQHARARWERIDDGNYDMTLTMQSMVCCGDPVSVSVRNGVVVEAHNAIDGRSVSTVYVPTVDKIFDEIRDALRGEHGRIALEFDARLGYPILANLDRFKNSADDEVVYQIVKLTPQRTLLLNAAPLR